MKVCWTALLLFCLLPVVPASARESYELVKNGSPGQNRIQMNADPSAPEFLAAKELQEYIRKISGASLPCHTQAPAFQRLTGTDPDFLEITLATLENGKYLLPESVKKQLAAAPSEQAFCIKTDGNRILIAGKSPIGVLYGAYTFLEKYLGVRWFHAGPEGEYCPKNRTIVLRPMDDFQSPALDRRMIGTWRAAVAPWKLDDFYPWCRKNKLQYGLSQHPNRSREELDLSLCGDEKPVGGGHSTFEQAVPNKLFASHPEYFPLQGGKRVCKERSQRCLSNPDVQKMVVDFGVELGKYGTLFGVGFHDSTDGWCECDNCRKLGTFNGAYKLNTLAHRFAAKMTSEILKRNPDVGGQRILVYSDFRDPLEDPSIQYDARVKALYCSHQRCYVHALDDASNVCNRKFYREILAWKKHCPNLGIYDYYAYANSPYAPMEYTLARDLKLYRKMGLKSFYDDCTNKDLPIPSSNWQFYYVLAKMAWNADLDVEKLMDEAYSLYYGSASVPMKQYHALRRELWESAPGHAAYGGGARIGYCLTVEGAEARLMNFLAQAEKLAGNDSVLRKRIAMDREYLNRFWVAEAAKIKKLISGQKNIPAVRADGPVKIDAELNEDVWRRAPLVTGFRTLDGHSPVESTRVKVAYDAENWYFAVEAMTEHAWGPLKAAMTKKDSAVYQDDAIEFFLMPPGSDYYHIVVNSLGTVYDAKIRDITYDSKAEVRTKVLKDRYVLEMRIPVAPMGAAVRDGQVWQMHLYRDSRNLQPPKTSEGSSLDGTPPHEQTRFRRAVIGESAMNNGDFTKLRNVPPAQKDKIAGTQFPDGWNGVGVEMIRENGRNAVLVKNVLYSMMNVPRTEKANRITGEVLASGKGTLSVSVSSCVRKPGDKRGFGHEKRQAVLTVNLTEKPAVHPFRVQFEPYECGYIYLNASDAKVQHVVASRTEE